MNIRHIGFFVNDIYYVSHIFVMLGFECVYDEKEYFAKKYRIIRKYELNGIKIELIECDKVPKNIYHICFDGDIPDFLLDETIAVGNPLDKKLESFFVYTDDSIYFEFVRNKNA